MARSRLSTGINIFLSAAVRSSCVLSAPLTFDVGASLHFSALSESMPREWILFHSLRASLASLALHKLRSTLPRAPSEVVNRTTPSTHDPFNLVNNSSPSCYLPPLYRLTKQRTCVSTDARAYWGRASAIDLKAIGSLHPLERVRVLDWSLTTMMTTAVPFSHRHHTIQPETVLGTLPVHSIH